jgi:hypothetical protein
MCAYSHSSKNKNLTIIHDFTSIFDEYTGIVCVNHLMTLFQIKRLNGVAYSRISGHI